MGLLSNVTDPLIRRGETPGMHVHRRAMCGHRKKASSASQGEGPQEKLNLQTP